jgi:ABC-type hemin transport system ATPase subunit
MVFFHFCFWTDIVDAKLLSRMATDFPVVAAICGEGSSGKSTLFNSLVGDHLSPTGGTAGLNRRVVFSIPAVTSIHYQAVSRQLSPSL